jgi:hypothetical protein
MEKSMNKDEITLEILKCIENSISMAVKSIEEKMGILNKTTVELPEEEPEEEPAYCVWQCSSCQTVLMIEGENSERILNDDVRQLEDLLICSNQECKTFVNICDYSTYLKSELTKEQNDLIKHTKPAKKSKKTNASPPPPPPPQTSRELISKIDEKFKILNLKFPQKFRCGRADYKVTPINQSGSLARNGRDVYVVFGLRDGKAKDYVVKKWDTNLAESTGHFKIVDPATLEFLDEQIVLQFSKRPTYNQNLPSIDEDENSQYPTENEAVNENETTPIKINENVQETVHCKCGKILKAGSKHYFVNNRCTSCSHPIESTSPSHLPYQPGYRH